MDDPLDGHIPDLIALLELRARYVEQEVTDRYRPRVARKYLPRFFDLHRAYVDALRRGDLFGAHDLEERFYELALEAAMADRPWLRTKIFNALWRLNLSTGLFWRTVRRMMRHEVYAPHFDPPHMIADEYLHPERIGAHYRRWDSTPDQPPTQKSLKRYYLAMLDDGERAGYKSAQALLRRD